ncbi:hypothetical protein F4782DRAFT_525654 [Xylaria castorea]|nr:hypothetical protein F4782DRAFT_525654 [Xylaria castorea]
MSGNILEEDSISTIPSVARACREARAIAILTGALRGVQIPTMKFGPKNSFCLDDDWSQRGSRYKKKLSGRADLFNDSSLALYISNRLFNPNLFSSLQTVSFIVDRIRLCRNMDSAAQVRVLGLDGSCHCLVDIEDIDKIKGLRLERDPKNVESLKWGLHCKGDE